MKKRAYALFFFLTFLYIYLKCQIEDYYMFICIAILSLLLNIMPANAQPAPSNGVDYTMKYYTDRNEAERNGVYHVQVDNGESVSTEAYYIREQETLYDSVFNVLKDNLWFVVVVCILVIVVLYGVILFIFAIFKWIGKRFENTEYIEIGKLKIKNKNFKPADDTQTNPQMFDIQSFMLMIDIILSNEIKQSITKTIDIMNSIHAIENIYNSQCESIFRNTFTNLRNEYHERIVSYASEVTGFTMDSIHRTREYFFISDMLHSAEIFWMDQSKDIISRNGFIEICDDKRKCVDYISELQECIWRAMDVRKLEATVLRKKDLDDIINDIMRSTSSQLETMFIRLGNLKKNMVSKKNEKMKYVDSAISNSIANTIRDIKSRFFGNSDENSSDSDKIGVTDGSND